MELHIVRRALASLLATATPAAIANDDSQGLAANVVYTAEYVRVLEGGIERGGAFLGNLDVDLRYQFEGGATAYVYLLGNHGEDPSALAGDAQGLSNITAPNAVRLYEAWIQGTVAGVDLKFGLYDLNSEFDALEVASLFGNSSFGIGPDFAQAGPMGPSIFPITGLGLRARIGAEHGAYAQFAVVDGQPGDPDDERETSLRIDRHDGALIVAEVGHLRSDEDGGYRKLSLGAWHFTQRFERIDDGESTRGNQGMYASAEGHLADWGSGAVHGFARIGVADDELNDVQYYAGAGLVATGVLAGRPDDRFGIALARAQFGDDARAASGLESAELAIEANYELPVTDWLTVQPNVQYISDPGADPTLDNAWVIGTRLVFTYAR